MPLAREQRKLAAIVAADVVGYSRLMGRDESGTLAALKALRREVVDPMIDAHNGRIVKTTGDGLLLEFPSVVDAVRCVIEVQTEVAARSVDVPEERRIAFRVGVNLGDVIVDGDDIFGDGVNVAARLEALADPGGICLSEDAVRQVRGKVEAAFDSMGVQSLKNIAQAVNVWRWVSADGSSASAPVMPLTLPDKPSIAVLPFQNMSGDPEQEYFVDGLVEDIITALSRFRSLFVIARNSSFTYKGRAVNIKQVGRELGVRYVLEGSVRKAGNRLRITGQLIDAETGAHLWADRFDGPLEDIFELQDRLTTTVVGAIAPKVERAEVERARRKLIENLDAYDYFLRGLAEIHKRTFESWTAGLKLFYRAIECDPEFAAPYAMATRCYAAIRQSGWESDRLHAEAETRRLVLRATAVGGDDALALCWTGYGLAYVCGELEKGAALIERGLPMNENLAVGWQVRAAIGLWQGRYDSVADWVTRAKRLNPVDPEAFRSDHIMALVTIARAEYGEAVLWSTKALMPMPSWPPGLWTAAVSNALAGNLAEAQGFVRQLRDVSPESSIGLYRRILPFHEPVLLEKVIQGLRLAGLPE
jgi:TolB-like protein/class 3 adenylate cyclase